MKSLKLLVCIFILLAFSFAAQAKIFSTEVLVVGGSQSGVPAAVQAARQGSKVLLVSQTDWLGGSMVEAGVAAIDGNELLAFQTGLWGEFLKRLAVKDKDLLKYSWVSFFAFNPQFGKQVYEEWLREEQNINWLKNLKATEVIFEANGKFKKVVGVKFIPRGCKKNCEVTEVRAKVTIDATETGDLLEISDIPHRLGWEYAGEFNEPSAPKGKTKLAVRYPLQELTWVFYLKDYGTSNSAKAPTIATPSGYTYERAAERYWCAFKNEKLIKEARKFSLNPTKTDWAYKYKQAEKYTQFFDKESFLTYGQVSPDLFMINWPKCGNDYSLGIERIFSSKPSEREQFYREAQAQSLWFAKYIQDTFGERFGLAPEVFPADERNNEVGGLAYIPYNREVIRLEGFKTLTENDILPKLAEGEQARYLPDSIAMGNYANDHHYFEMAKPNSANYFKLAPKSIQWGGRYTGTPFSIPYKALLPVQVDGLIVAEKSWSVSHIANGSSRLQPVCILIGQAAGAAAALAAQKNIQPFELSVAELQATLLNDEKAPPTLIPLFDVKPNNPHRAAIQRLIISGVIDFPKDGQFRPSEIISAEEFANWSHKAGFEGQISINLTRAEAAGLIETSANTLKSLPVKAATGQSLANYDVQEYCADFKQGGNKKSFKLEWIKTKKDNQPIIRQTPFASNQANTAGAITFDPEVYDFMLKNADAKPKKICFKGAYNHGGAWMMITEVLK